MTSAGCATGCREGFIKKITKPVASAGKTVGGGVAKAGKTVGGGVAKAGKKVGGAFGSVFGFLDRIFKNAKFIISCVLSCVCLVYLGPILFPALRGVTALFGMGRTAVASLSGAGAATAVAAAAPVSVPLAVPAVAAIAATNYVANGGLSLGPSAAPAAPAAVPLVQ